jgi:hypothetical protein
MTAKQPCRCGQAPPFRLLSVPTGQPVGHKLHENWDCHSSRAADVAIGTGIASTQPDDGEGTPITGDVLTKANVVTTGIDRPRTVPDRLGSNVTGTGLIQGITDAAAQPDLIPPVGQPESLRQDALSGKLLQVLGLSLGEDARICVYGRCQDQGYSQGRQDGRQFRSFTQVLGTSSAKLLELIAA